MSLANDTKKGAAFRMPAQRPMLETDRLILRPFAASDAPDVMRLAGDFAIADTTLTIPHPYGDGLAEIWIASHQSQFDQGRLINFALTLRESGALVGSMNLVIKAEHLRAELGYWVGKPFWKQGYCTEAARTVVRYGFEALGLNRIYACHLRRNPASGRVLQKLGMVSEGCQREAVVKWNRFEDLEYYGLLRRDFIEAAGR